VNTFELLPDLFKHLVYLVWHYTGWYRHACIHPSVGSARSIHCVFG